MVVSHCKSVIKGSLWNWQCRWQWYHAGLVAPWLSVNSDNLQVMIILYKAKPNFTLFALKFCSCIFAFGLWHCKHYSAMEQCSNCHP